MQERKLEVAKEKFIRRQIPVKLEVPVKATNCKVPVVLWHLDGIKEVFVAVTIEVASVIKLSEGSGARC